MYSLIHCTEQVSDVFSDDYYSIENLILTLRFSFNRFSFSTWTYIEVVLWINLYSNREHLTK